MRKYNIKLISGIFHGIFAAILVAGMLFSLDRDFNFFFSLLWLSCIAFGSFYGVLLSSWYIPIENERFYIEPYVVTPLVSLFTALSGALFSGLALEIYSTPIASFSLTDVFGVGLFAGTVGFLLALPITLLVGILAGVLFQRLCGNKQT